jgi:ABC-type antimicrobial peptide transport system permease subunit
MARAVVRESLQNTIAGVALGGIMSIAAGRFVQSLLVDTSAADPWTLGTVAATLIGVAILAGLGPALRAARVDPIEALRAE